MFHQTVLSLVVLSTIWHYGYGLPLEVTTSELGQSPNFTQGLEYLQNYGYISPPSDTRDSLLRVVDIEGAIRRLQLYGNIEQTGQLDQPTLDLMARPRCGVPDPAGVGEHGDALGGALEKREKRYAHTGGTWKETTLTYRILNSAGSGVISPQQSNGALRRAFKVWSDVTPLVFEEKDTGAADIYLKFGARNHGDLYPFDGPSGTLAHAYPPQSGSGDLDGDVHFDDDEAYIEGVADYPKINLFITAAHEIGHALGLGHSTEPGSLMAPFYQGYDPKWTLPYDDQYGIQLLYGSKPVPGPGPGPGGKPTDKPAQPKPTIKPAADACSTMSFKAIAYIRGELFAFKGDRYWRIRALKQLLTSIKGDETKYFWYQLPMDIDASYERYHDQRILFFKGDQYWEYDGLHTVTGFPKPIKNLDPALPSNVDAVLTYNEYQKTYFFKGLQVWRYDEPTQSVDEGWPYDIDYIFSGVPSNLDAAFRYKDGVTTFVKGPKYYVYSDSNRTVENGYPKSFGTDYLGCEPGKLEGQGENAASLKTPTILGIVLGTIMVVLNMLL